MKHHTIVVLVMMMCILLGCDPSSPSVPAITPIAVPTIPPNAAQPLDGPIKIGAGFALTGANALLDKPAANGVQLAVKEINAKGGLLGQPIDLILRDTNYKMDLTAQIAKELVEQDNVIGVVGFTDTDSVLAFAPAMQQAGLPFITPGATSPKLSLQFGDNIFQACFGDNTQAAAGAEFGFSTFGPTAYLLWDSGLEYTALLGEYFKTRFTSLGGTIALEDTFDDKTTNFAVQIATLKALPRQPDFYYIAATSYNSGLIIQQLRAAGLNTPIIGGDGYDTPELLTVAGSAANDVYFTTHVLLDSGGNQAIQSFIAAYKAEYGHMPENAFAALGYDAMRLLADAITRAKSTDPTAIKRALEATNRFPAVTGTLSFSPTSHTPQKSVTIVNVHDNTFTRATEFVPKQIPAP